jgi:hypothetical protein
VAFNIAKRFYPLNVVPSFPVLHGPFIPSRTLDRLAALAEIDLEELELSENDERFTPIAPHTIHEPRRKKGQ